MYAKTTAYRKLLSLDARIRGIAGGTSASKTISILLILISIAQTKDNFIISIVSESFPHLNRGVIRDFLLIMKEQGYYEAFRWNKTNHTYTFSTNTIIEFFSVEEEGKVRGSRRDILFINEANNIPFATYTQLEVRTRKHVWLDWNPSSEFWFYTDVLPNSNNVDFLTLTYLDNESLEKSIIASIESKRHNTNWWRVFGLGQLGELEGKIYNNWRIINSVPNFARFECGYLDYGYSNDPTAAGAIYYIDGWYIIDQLIHETGLLNNQIAKVLLQQLPKDPLIIADSAEPKSNAELTLYGLSVLGATKGKDSIVNGIQNVQGLNIAVTKRSIDVIKEYRNYLWLVDKNGKKMNVPIDIWNHHMDGIRYAFAYLQPYVDEKMVGSVSPQKRQLAPIFTDELGDIGDAFADAEEEVGRVTTRSQL